MENNYKICPNCNGDGVYVSSDCCGAEPSSNGDGSLSDYGLCPECGEHCEYVSEKCETCNGEGEIPRDETDDFNDKLHEAEHRFESKKDDIGI